jgi:inward rectifier potassium channel
VAGPTKEDINRDLGLGSRVANKGRGRFLNRDGSFNVVRRGLPFFRSLSAYHALLTVSWPRFFGLVVAGYFLTNLLFASLYLSCGPEALQGSEGGAVGNRFGEAFFFSVQTLATIGYGRISPHGLAANLLVTVEALTGLLGFALATGILFARFSRPTARILFSRQAVIAPYRGGLGLMFRIANERRNQLFEVQATVTLTRWEMIKGVRDRSFHELALERRRVVFFPLHWVVVHPIDEKSPLWGVSAEEFMASEPEVFVLLTGVDETFSQTVHTRSSYDHREIVWGARFKDMYLEQDDPLGVDLRLIHEIERDR